MSNEQNKKLIEAFLNGYNQINRIVAYESILGDKDTNWLKRRFQECLVTFERCPTIAEILQTNTKETADIEQAWEIFVNTYCNNHKFEPMLDWVYTIKRAIGEDEVENCTPEDLKWIKKEFIRIYPAVKSGMMELKQEPYKYQIENGVTLRLPSDESLLLENTSKTYSIAEVRSNLEGKE